MAQVIGNQAPYLHEPQTSDVLRESGQAVTPGPSNEVSRAQAASSDAVRNSRTRTVSFNDVESVHSPQEHTLGVQSQFTTNSSRLSRRLQRASGRSLWRYPSNTGQVPRYMQRAFRVKTFGLLALQLLVALAIGAVMSYLKLWKEFEIPSSPAVTEVITYSTGAVNLLCVLLLHFLSDRFPANYLCLLLTTMVSGFFWGLTHLAPQFGDELVHVQIGLILFITMFVAAVVSYILDSREEKITGSSLIAISLGSGYLLGAITNVLLFTLVLEATPFQIFGGIGFALLLLGILLLDVGGLLITCQPDDFMTVIVAMNSTLLVIVSIPFFFLGFCILRLGEAREVEEPHAPEIPEANSRR
ncbi:unnamed protein product [Symbiodinium pilosum]|uniref:Uncharacterized protein n=1 Tax=Symbiodinium pilosum TaxID=2952 RepID=A0A812QVB1_SYMPI|nr:unnamed protein product [Symbiodinium pilosum]